jgi:hypothetical protein
MHGRHMDKLISHSNERDVEVVQVLDCMIEARLTRIDWYYLHTNKCILFLVSYNISTL